MNADEYDAAQAAITALVVQFVLQLTSYFLQPRLGAQQWLGLLRLVFPEVQQRRHESAQLARRFYDSQRQIHVPALPRNDVDLAGTSFEEFVKQMEPARKRMSLADSPADAQTRFTLQATREVENAGRRTIIQAVNLDAGLVDHMINEMIVRSQESAAREPELAEVIPFPTDRTRVVRGWARVATGRETCSWCLMLISRGPVYYEADRAGLKYDERLAIDLYRKTPALGNYYDEINDLMEEWHPGCDCKVVPVFKAEEWPGYPAMKRAEDLWIQAADEARAWREKYPDRVHLTGENRGQLLHLQPGSGAGPTPHDSTWRSQFQ